MITKEQLEIKYCQEKKSMKVVAGELGVSPSTVHKKLKQYGIKPRDRRESKLLYFEQNETVDSSFFKVMSPELAYILGLWITDGCAYERGSFSLGLKDKEVIEWVAKTIGYKNKIWEITEKINGTKRYFMQFTNQEVKKVFDSYGVVPNKSFITAVPDLPKEFLPHFVRGVFEGDGHIGKYKSSYTVSIVSASKVFIDRLKEVIEDEIGGDRVVRFDKRGKGLYLYNVYGKETINEFGKWIYPENTFGMERKLKKFIELRNSLSE